MSRRAPVDYEINNPLTNSSYSFSGLFKDLPLFISKNLLVFQGILNLAQRRLQLIFLMLAKDPSENLMNVEWSM